MARVTAPCVFYHLIWRFVDRSWFFTDDHERWMYLRLLERALAISDWQCLGYALMSNHIHLGAIAGNEPLGRWAKRVSSPFARWMNHRHDRLGPVIADRPKSCAVASEREPRVIAYIHNNPVRAGVVTNACDSTWTSHRLYAFGETSFIDTAAGLDRWGFTNSKQFDAWITKTPGESGFPDRDVRAAARRRGALEIATPTSPLITPLVARPFAHVRIDPRLVVAVAAQSVGTTVAETCSRKRNPQVVAARHVAVQLAEQFGVCGSDIASALGMSPAGVTQARRRAPSAIAERALRGAVTRMEVEVAFVSENRPSSLK
jgi:Transposase IS200 like